jgi:hypothetical protein
MMGSLAMEPVMEQVQNVPDYVNDIVVISGSGLSALSIMLGLAKFKKKVKAVHAVCLSNHIGTNMGDWYITNPLSDQCKAKLELITSHIPYRTEYKWNKSFDWDLIYESKAYKWMTENFKPSKKVLFWVVGKKLYDLDLIEPINWHQSLHEKELRNPVDNSIDRWIN